MPTTRTQTYQRRRIDALAEAEGVTMSEIVRRALDAYLDHESPDPRPALAATYGADPGLITPSKDEWDRG